MISHQKNHLSVRKSILVSLFVIFFSVFFLYKYKQNNIVEKIFDFTDKHCNANEECVVNMANVTPFEWDYMYFIDSGQDPNRIERIINLKFDGFLDFSQGVFFIKDNIIVHYEGYFYDPDSSDERGLLLNFDKFENGMKPIKYYVMSKDNASVLIKKEITPYRIRYWLSYANENQVVRGDVIYQGEQKIKY